MAECEITTNSTSFMVICRRLQVLSLRVFAYCAPFLLLVACVSSPRNMDDQTSQAQRLISQALSADAGAGIAAAVVRDGRLIWSGASGYSDLENLTRMAPDTPTRIGSVSKPITALLLLKFAEQNAVDLDIDIQDLVDVELENWNGAALSHLATHTSGVRHYDFSNFEEANNLYYKETLADSVAQILSEEPLFAPGERFEYSSHGYNIIGAMLERLSEQSFQTLMSDVLTTPMTLKHTGVDHPLEIIPGRSRQYTVTAANPVFSWMEDGALINTFYRDSSDYYPSGGLLSSANDLARFTSMVFETDFLSDGARSHILQAARLHNGEAAGFADDHLYSFGWEIRQDENGRVIFFGHNGETNGAYAVIRYFPKEKLAIAGVANYNVMGREPAFFEVISADLRTIFAD